MFVGGQSMGGTAAILCGITRPDLYQVQVLHGLQLVRCLNAQ